MHPGENPGGDFPTFALLPLESGLSTADDEMYSKAKRLQSNGSRSPARLLLCDIEWSRSIRGSEETGPSRVQRLFRSKPGDCPWGR